MYSYLILVVAIILANVFSLSFTCRPKMPTLVTGNPRPAKDTKPIIISFDVGGKDHARAVEILFNHMVNEKNDNTDWEREEDWIEKQTIKTNDLFEVTKFLEGFPSLAYGSFADKLAKWHEINDIDLNLFRNPTFVDGFVEFFFNKTTHGIGWCRIGRVKGAEENTFDIAYNMLSFTIDNSYSTENFKVAYRILRFRAHRSIAKFRNLYRHVMVTKT